MSQQALDHLISDQQKLLSWHLKNMGIAETHPLQAHTQQFKSIPFDANLIDHTLLKPQATTQELETHCEEALRFSFGAVCVHSSYLPLAVKKLANSSVQPICVVGFPLGCVSPEQKAIETQMAIAMGAQEIDMVLHMGRLKSKSYDLVFQDVFEVVKAAQGHPVKVILETCLLTTVEKIQACFLSAWAGAAFVKTSTGFSHAGATLEDVALMRKVVGPNIGVKASGGIKTYEDAMSMLQAGASRIGTSSGVSMMQKKENVSDTTSSQLY